VGGDESYAWGERRLTDCELRKRIVVLFRRVRPARRQDDRLKPAIDRSELAMRDPWTFGSISIVRSRRPK